MNSIGIVWAQFGPYHHARAAALQKQAGGCKVQAIRLADQTALYEWKRPASAANVLTLCPGAVTEDLTFWKVFFRARRMFVELKLEVCMLPSYWPKQSLGALLAAKSLGIRTVMMNESHAGTAQSRGVATWVKHRLARLFDAALVGGLPQKRYFESMGMAAEKIFTGYDAVDNHFFASKSDEIRGRQAQVRNQYGLPEHYFLSLGRLVGKKNLSVLIRAYQKFLAASPDHQTHLVLVGSGEEETRLRGLCRELQLPVYEKKNAGMEDQKPETNGPPGIHFYGFRQIEENPVFYALADAFILPSLWEEWGLVVNEAMACGLPVIVSETAGCAEDLLKPGLPESFETARVEFSARWPQMGGFIRQNGFVFNPQSHEALALAMQMLSSSLSLREVMGQASRKIVGHYSCENFARQALLAARVANGESISASRYLSEGQPVVENSKLIP